MIESRIKVIYQKLITKPISRSLARYTEISPIGLTLTALCLGIISAFLLIMGLSVSASIFLVLSGFLDSLDGALAREKNCASEKGAVLDIFSDRIVEFSIMFALFYIDPTNRALPVIWMLGSSFICVTSFLVVGVFTKNTSDKGFYYSAGLMERLEAFIFFILMMLIPSWFVPLAWIYTALVFVTAIRRIDEFFKFNRVGVEP